MEISNEEIMAALLVSFLMETNPRPFGELSKESIKEFGRIVTRLGRDELDRRREDGDAAS